MFQQGSSDWCIMTTLKKTPENRLSISRMTLITTVLEQNCSVKQCCSYFSFTLSTSNDSMGTHLTFKNIKWMGFSDSSEEPSSGDQWNTAEAKLASFAHKHGWFTLPQKGRRLPSQGFRSLCKAPSWQFWAVHDTATYSPQARWEQNKRCSATKSSPTLPSTNCIRRDPVCKGPREIQALGFSMGFNSHRHFGAFGVVS